MKIYIQARGSYETLLNLSSWAEQNEVERIGLPDHYIVGKQRHDKDNPAPALDLLTASAGLVRDTEKMIYSILVSPITFRHPSVLVKMASTINEMAPNRFRLGVGTGWLEIEHELFGIPFPELKTRFEMLEEALIYIREALSGNNQGFKGEYYQLEKFPVEPATLSEIPIIIVVVVEKLKHLLLLENTLRNSIFMQDLKKHFKTVLICLKLSHLKMVETKKHWK